MRLDRLPSLWMLAALLCGCRPTAPSTESQAPAIGPTQAQPTLPIAKLWVGQEEVRAEVARGALEIQTGMMFREQMAENEGMLFVFPQPYRASFWMRNTKLPLSCAYIDQAGVILELRDMKPLDESPITAETDQVQYVLEMRQGWFERHQIRPGMVLRADRGSLGETFLGSKKR